MKKFDNFSAIEDLSMDSEFFNISTSSNLTANESISLIQSVYNNLRNRTANFFDDYVGRQVNNYQIGGEAYGTIRGEGYYYDPIFTSYNALNTLSTTQLSDFANSIRGLYISDGSNINPSYNVKTFRVQAQKYFPELKKTWTFYGDLLKNNILESLSQEYQDVFKEPFYSENFSEQDKVNAYGEMVDIALRDDLSLNEKKNLFEEVIKIYAPSLPSSSSISSTSTTEEQRGAGATTDSKINIAKYAIIGGVLVVGGVATWLILKRK